jgi:hypothetical protein
MIEQWETFHDREISRIRKQTMVFFAVYEDACYAMNMTGPSTLGNRRAAEALHGMAQCFFRLSILAADDENRADSPYTPSVN